MKKRQAKIWFIASPTDSSVKPTMIHCQTLGKVRVRANS